MRATLPCLPALLCLKTFARQAVSDSRQSSACPYVYRLTPAEARTCYRHRMKEATEQYLHSLVDSFYTDDKSPGSLGPGNYLLVSAVHNRLVARLHTVNGLSVKVLNNHHRPAIAFNRNGDTLQREPIALPAPLK